MTSLRRIACLVLAACAGLPATAGAAQARFSESSFRSVGDDPVRAVAADLNGDGHADLATADFTSSTVSVLLGDGTGNFAPRTAYPMPKHPGGIVAADLDSDGRRDLAVTSLDRAGSITLMRNRGDGSFERAGVLASGRRPYAVAAADLDHDGIVDLVTAHDDGRHLSVWRGQGGWRFGAPESYSGPRGYDVALGDLNRDGTLDVVLSAGSGTRSVAVRYGNGDGTFGLAFTYRVGRGAFGVALADFNGDRRLDIASANYGAGTVAILLARRGIARFRPATRYSIGIGISVDAVLVADYDGDGILDIAAPEYGGPVLRRGRGDGTFGAEHQVSPSGDITLGGATADFNEDGRPDLVFPGACDDESCHGTWVQVFINWTGLPAPPCVVPPLVDEPLEGGKYSPTARTSLREQGCRLGRITAVASDTVRRGRIIAQSIAEETVAPAGTAVDVVVSLGSSH